MIKKFTLIVPQNNTPITSLSSHIKDSYLVLHTMNRILILTHGASNGTFKFENDIIDLLIDNKDTLLICCYPDKVAKRLESLSYRLGKQVIQFTGIIYGVVLNNCLYISENKLELEGII